MKLSVVIPTYNEENRLPDTLLSIDQYLKKQPYQSEIIVVDNNSQDRSEEVALKLIATKIDNTRLIKEPRQGKGAAVKCGVNEAKGEYIIFVDADNAAPLSELEKIWSHLEHEQYDIVIGSRYLKEAKVIKKQPFYQILLSRMGNKLIFLIGLTKFKDTQLGFKIFKNRIAKELFALSTVNGWGFDIEILAIAKIRGYRTKEVGIVWQYFQGSHVTLLSYWHTLMDLFKIKYNVIAGRYQNKKKLNNS